MNARWRRLAAVVGVVCVMILVVGACGKDDGPTEPKTNPPPADGPVITAVDPANLTGGTFVNVTGLRFGDNGELLLGGEVVTVQYYSDTLIVFQAPQRVFNGRLGLVVRTGGEDSPVFDIQYTEPAQRQLTFLDRPCEGPVWNTAGTHIYFNAEGPGGTQDIYAVPFEGGDPVHVYDSGGDDRNLEISRLDAVLWCTNTDDHANTQENYEVWYGATLGFNPRGPVDPGSVGTEDVDESFPAFNNDVSLGAEYAWVQLRLGGPMIYVLQDLLPRNLVSGYSPRFRPSIGDRLAYAENRDDGGVNIMLIELTPSAVEDTIYGAADVSGSIDWTGTRILYQKGLWGQLWHMNEEGEDHRLILEDTERKWGPRWSPNGQYVAFVKLTAGDSEIFVAKVP